MLGQSISRNGVLLGAFAIFTTAVIAATWLGSQDRIAENRRQAEQRALLAIVPRDQHDNEMLDDTLSVDNSTLLGLRAEAKIYRARRDGEVVAVILPAVARDGYTGDIELIVGVRSNGEVAGVRVLSHRETPGLGDKVDYKKSQWVDGFIGRSLGNPPASRWTVKKEGGVFDQFTGATITPRAVTAAVKRALQYFEAERKALLNAEAGSHLSQEQSDS